MRQLENIIFIILIGIIVVGLIEAIGVFIVNNEECSETIIITSNNTPNKQFKSCSIVCDNGLLLSEHRMSIIGIDGKAITCKVLEK